MTKVLGEPSEAGARFRHADTYLTIFFGVTTAAVGAELLPKWVIWPSVVWVFALMLRELITFGRQVLCVQRRRSQRKAANAEVATDVSVAFDRLADLMNDNHVESAAYFLNGIRSESEFPLDAGFAHRLHVQSLSKRVRSLQASQSMYRTEPIALLSEAMELAAGYWGVCRHIQEYLRRASGVSGPLASGLSAGQRDDWVRGARVANELALDLLRISRRTNKMLGANTVPDHLSILDIAN